MGRCRHRSVNMQTGVAERIQIDKYSPWWGEHTARYLFARDFVCGKYVLDIASGTGFGAAMLLGSGAAVVVGVDLSFEAVQSSRSEFADSRIQFVQATCSTLPFADNSFEVVTSFETIEHLHDHGAFIAEIKRVLKPHGFLILSTPNASITSKYPKNPYHIQEFRADELYELLSAQFEHTSIYGQHLNAVYPVQPFLPGHEQAHTLAEYVYTVFWKIGLRFPALVREFFAELFTGRSFYPGATDYEFRSGLTEGAHVLLAVCASNHLSLQPGNSNPEVAIASTE